MGRPRTRVEASERSRNEVARNVAKTHTTTERKIAFSATLKPNVQPELWVSRRRRNSECLLRVGAAGSKLIDNVKEKNGGGGGSAVFWSDFG